MMTFTKKQKLNHPLLGAAMTVHGVAGKIIAVHDFGTVDVEQVRTGRAYRVTGLCIDENGFFNPFA